jgi:hypothetical protein
MPWAFGLAPSPWKGTAGNDTWRGALERLWRHVMGRAPYF